jgi:hypothetical protein
MDENISEKNTKEKGKTQRRKWRWKRKEKMRGNLGSNINNTSRLRLMGFFRR